MKKCFLLCCFLIGISANPALMAHSNLPTGIDSNAPVLVHSQNIKGRGADIGNLPYFKAVRIKEDKPKTAVKTGEGPSNYRYSSKVWKQKDWQKKIKKKTKKTPNKKQNDGSGMILLGVLAMLIGFFFLLYILAAGLSCAYSLGYQCPTVGGRAVLAILGLLGGLALVIAGAVKKWESNTKG